MVRYANSQRYGPACAGRAFARQSPAQAHRIVSAAAKRAWRQDRQFADVLAEDSPAGLTREEIQAEVDAQRADSERLATARALATVIGMRETLWVVGILGLALAVGAMTWSPVRRHRTLPAPAAD